MENVVAYRRRFEELKMNEEKYVFQQAFCKEKQLPVLASPYCPNCDREVYSVLTVEECKTRLITKCPFCNYSFAE